MATIFANAAVDLSSRGGLGSYWPTNYRVVSVDHNQAVIRYWVGANQTVDVTMGGKFYFTSSILHSGAISSMTISAIGGGTLLSISNIDLKFYSFTDLTTVMNNVYIFTNNDQIFGSPSNDVLYGYVGDDQIFAGAGDDLISGGPGSDTIDGGDGNDTIISDQLSYVYNQPNYYRDSKVIAYGGQTAVLGLNTDCDLLTNVEYIRFNDKTVPTASAVAFDAMGYLAVNRDLSSAFGTNGAAAFLHFVQKGFYERRPTSFDAASYIAANLDLAAAFGSNTAAATEHYVAAGRLEGRSTSFNSLAYIAANPDLIKAFGTNATAAAMHYVTTGRLEGRTTNFNTAAYMARNPDAGKTEQVALAHYITYGYREGRSTAPLTTTGRSAALIEANPLSGALANPV
ncbi:calcium-binding protein [Azospirillum melinis]